MFDKPIKTNGITNTTFKIISVSQC